MRPLVGLVEHYLREWDSRGWAHAYHSLVELGPQVLPELEARFAEARDAAFRAALVELAGAMRTSAALPLLTLGLADPSPDVWKAALDACVALASPEAVAALESALAGPPPGRTAREDWQEWVAEALDQARAACATRERESG